MKTLDLHKVKHEDVKRRAVRFIESCLMNTDGEAKIMTGHSNTMRELVLEVLKEYELEHYVGGVLGVDRSFIKIIF